MRKELAIFSAILLLASCGNSDNGQAQFQQRSQDSPSVSEPQSTRSQAPQATSEPPFTASVEGPPMNGQSILKLTATADQVVFQNIEVNRGNCKVILPAPMTFPFSVTFGETPKMFILCRSGDVLEAVITANNQQWTVRF